MKQDINLRGNEKIEEALQNMYQNMCDETLFEVLSVIRQRKNAKGHFVIAVNESMTMRTITLEDKTVWFAAFTSLEEEIKKTDRVVSGFTAEIGSIFKMALGNNEISGVLLNPWNNPLKIDRNIMELL